MKQENSSKSGIMLAALIILVLSAGAAMDAIESQDAILGGVSLLGFVLAVITALMGMRR